MIKREYYDNGQIMYEVSYHEGLKHSIKKGWYYKGQLMYKHPYHEGLRHGVAKWWYESGRLWYKLYYLYDNTVTKEEYRKHELIVKLSGL